ncbi:MAG: hypothetical protein D6741_18350 [Planctomycetota bacterium]|nr:MAG: hypothetical protein D6741_18350 [Planctomycetota bacterium]
MKKVPKIHALLNAPKSGSDIETMSFRSIDERADRSGFTDEQWPIVRRMIHAAGDPGLAAYVRMSDDAVSTGVRALREGRPLYVDTNMVRAGLSRTRLQRASANGRTPRIYCFVGDSDVADEAERTGLPRAVAAVRKALPILDGAVVVIGNSPTALLEVNRLIIEEGLSPAIVIGVPVGFIHVEESKQELMDLGVPYVTVCGTRGGSPLAVAVVHALAQAAIAASESTSPGDDAFDAVVLLGHGSRVSTADAAMCRIAEVLSRRRGVPVFACNMSQRPPYLADALARCAAANAQRVLVLPYFVNEGMHVRADIPRLLKAEASKHAKLQLVLGPNLGYDPLLVDLVEKRMVEAAVMPDIRTVAIPDEAELVADTESVAD